MVNLTLFLILLRFLYNLLVLFCYCCFLFFSFFSFALLVELVRPFIYLCLFIVDVTMREKRIRTPDEFRSDEFQSFVSFFFSLTILAFQGTKKYWYHSCAMQIQNNRYGNVYSCWQTVFIRLKTRVLYNC